MRSSLWTVTAPSGERITTGESARTRCSTRSGWRRTTETVDDGLSGLVMSQVSACEARTAVIAWGSRPGRGGEGGGQRGGRVGEERGREPGRELGDQPGDRVPAARVDTSRCRCAVEDDGEIRSGQHQILIDLGWSPIGGDFTERADLHRPSVLGRCGPTVTEGLVEGDLRRPAELFADERRIRLLPGRAECTLLAGVVDDGGRLPAQLEELSGDVPSEGRAAGSDVQDRRQLRVGECDRDDRLGHVADIDEVPPDVERPDLDQLPRAKIADDAAGEGAGRSAWTDRVEDPEYDGIRASALCAQDQFGAGELGNAVRTERARRGLLVEAGPVRPTAVLRSRTEVDEPGVTGVVANRGEESL